MKALAFSSGTIQTLRKIKQIEERETLRFRQIDRMIEQAEKDAVVRVLRDEAFPSELAKAFHHEIEMLKY